MPMPPHAHNNYDAFYVIRILRPIPGNLNKTADRNGVYLTEKARLGALAKARRFETLDQAEQAIAHWPARERYTWQIQFCTREHQAPTVAPAQRALIDELMQIPHPYRRTAYNWARGLDVKSLLLQDSKATYDRHRRFLRDYDIDITQKPPVPLLTPRRKKIQLDNVPAATDNDPRHYFSAARPRAVPRGDANSGEE